MKQIDVSVVIVCMNNLDNLYPCLNSVLSHTTASYEILVVAFMFSKDNLDKLKKDYPQVIVIENNELRGFSENNNLALKQAKGEYCFILNDDTYFNDHVIDILLADFRNASEGIAVISPKTLNSDGSIQRSGKPKYNLFTYILYWMKLVRFYENKSKYTNGVGLFRTYNISGACFMIRTSLFKELGWFDEQYYFCPEDIALSTLINESGFMCYVDSSVAITHTVGGTWSKTLLATKPAQIKGEILFYGRKSFLNKIIVRIILMIVLPAYSGAYWLHYIVKKDDKSSLFARAYFNAIRAIFSDKTPKKLFIQSYRRIRNEENRSCICP